MFIINLPSVLVYIMQYSYKFYFIESIWFYFCYLRNSLLCIVFEFYFQFHSIKIWINTFLAKYGESETK